MRAAWTAPYGIDAAAADYLDSLSKDKATAGRIGVAE